MTNKRQKLLEVLEEVRRCYHDAIAEEIRHTSKSYALIGSEFGVSEQTVYTISRERGISRNSRGRKPNVGEPITDAISIDEGVEHEL